MLSGEYEQARMRLEEVHRAWSANATANQDRLADLARTLAELELLQGRIDNARSQIDASLVLFNYPANTSAPGLVAGLTAASRIYSAMGKLPEAHSFAVAALRISAGIARAPRQSADVGEALLVLAAALKAQGDRAGAQVHSGRAIEALSDALGQDHSLTREALGLQKVTTPGGPIGID